MSKKINKLIRILYIYDYKGWAIYNVGKLWLDDLPGVKVTLMQLHQFRKSNFDKYDLVWFGYSDLFTYHYSRMYISKKNLNKSIVFIHDPKELFPEIEAWKDVEMNFRKWNDLSALQMLAKLKILKKTRNLMTASKEMQATLRKYNLEAQLIPTTSSLDFKKEDKLKTDKCRILSVFEIYPRKNISLMKSLQQHCRNVLNIKFDTKVGKKVLSRREYTKLLDEHEIYLCTSYQEGGPIPAMDAIKRGSVVVSTPVGQIQDIIKDGENGFICKTADEFIDRIELLSKDQNLLHKMRINSLRYFGKHRDIKTIKSSVLELTKKISAGNRTVRHNSPEEILSFINYLPLAGLMSITTSWKLLANRLANTGQGAEI